ncbi:hypothetical protein E2320_003685 [Naja naja]|nr:hypothetical protein E2320_003685 [Naja naja]
MFHNQDTRWLLHLTLLCRRRTLGPPPPAPGSTSTPPPVPDLATWLPPNHPPEDTTTTLLPHNIHSPAITTQPLPLTCLWTKF